MRHSKANWGCFYCKNKGVVKTYSFIDMVIAAGTANVVGLFIGMVVYSVVTISAKEQEEAEHKRQIRAYEETIAKQAQVINEKNKFIIRFKYGCIDAVQKYLQDDVVACTMIIATINGFKEGQKGQT